jgi:hypothetical protein
LKEMKAIGMQDAAAPLQVNPEKRKQAPLLQALVGVARIG